ncbi:MAG: enoyl-CoA hydratase-related protein [Gammaproteobacteria bacterium]|nr:enoyl-CoA hydratase-related protein [Gammaproteobacteria bacterium]
MNYTQIRVETNGRIGTLVLDRPEYRNAQSRVLLEELDHAIHSLSDNSQIKVILITGEGDHFSAGHDLGTDDELADQNNRPIEEGVRGRYQRSKELYVDYTLRWRNIPKPTIAVVKGYCIFGGWMIASAMDLIFAADDAMFLATNFQYFSAPWDIHPRKLKEILFESRFIDGVEAKKLGLVNRVYAKAELMDETIAYAERVADNDRFQLRLIKLAVNQQQDTQGFAAHITAAHTMHVLSTEGERDPGYELKVPEGKRRPMVQRALENYKRHRDKQSL